MEKKHDEQNIKNPNKRKQQQKKNIRPKTKEKHEK